MATVAVKKPLEIWVDIDRCKGCGICVEFCPRRKMNVLKMSTRLNRKGSAYPIVENLEACTGCMICEQMCPDFAIWIVSD